MGSESTETTSKNDTEEKKDITPSLVSAAGTPNKTQALPSSTTAIGGAGKICVNRPAQMYEIILFFLSGIGIGIGWTVVLSCIVYYTFELGKKSYVYLNLAISIPFLPIAILQAKYDKYFDQKFRSSLVTYICRGTTGYATLLIVVGIVIPKASSNLLALSFATLILGCATAILFGTLQQMAAFVYQNCGRLPVSLSAGYQSAFLFVLAISLGTKFGSSGSSVGLYKFYGINAGVLAVSWLSFYMLMHHSSDVARSMRDRDSSIRLEGNSSTNVNKDDGNFNDIEIAKLKAAKTGKEQKREEAMDDDSSQASVFEDETVDSAISYRELWSVSWVCCVCLMLTMASSMMVTTFFNRVESADPNNTALPQVLFYVRQFADLMGRPFTLFMLPPPSAVQSKNNATKKKKNQTFLRWLCTVSLIRALVFVPLFFLYVTRDNGIVDIPLNDIAVILGVGIFMFLSGVITTIIYQRAPYLIVSDNINGNNLSVQTEITKLLNICFSVSMLFGLMLNIILQERGDL